MGPEAVEDELSYPEVMAPEHEVTPTIAASEVVTSTGEGVVPKVSAPGFFRGVPELSFLPRLMGGNFFSLYYERIAFVRSVICRI